MTRFEVYRLIYAVMKREFSNYSKYFLDYNPLLTFEDNASRMANIYAVQNTEELWRGMFKDVDLGDEKEEHY